MSEQPTYAYLAPREGSRYEQNFFKGRNLRAETLYRATIGLEPKTPDEVAEDYNVPVAAVLEAIQCIMPRCFSANGTRIGTKAKPEVR
jgi:hypothetical protein